MCPSGSHVSLCMITRDEEDFLPNCLASVRGVVDEIIVVDTGSTDRTIAIAREHGAFVREVAWTGDFSAARNVSLEMATREWILVLDADEEIHHEDRARVRDLIADKDAEAYMVRIHNLMGDATHPDVEVAASIRLFRNRWGYRFSGTLHEQVGENIQKQRPGTVFAPSGLRIHHYGYLAGLSRTAAKSERNLKLAEEQARTHPEDGFVLFNLGVEYQRLGRFEESAKSMELAQARAVPGAMWTSKLVKARVLSLVRLDRWDEAARCVEEGLERYPDFTDLAYFQGIIHHSKRQFTQAAGCFYQCLAMGVPPVPPYAAVEEGLATYKAHYALGQVYEDMGRHAQAVKAYQAAFDANPRWTAPLYRLAALLVPREDPAGVRAYLERFFDLSRQDHLITLSDIFCVAGGHAVALEYLERADSLAPATSRIHYLRGICYLRTGRFAGAIAEFDLITPESPYYRQSMLGLCFCYWSEDRLAEASAALRRIGGDDPAYLALAGMFLREAVVVLKEGLVRHPSAPSLRKALAQIETGGNQVAGGAR
jgi:glycosyltransferase involved in cell wall biosynthesis